MFIGSRLITFKKNKLRFKPAVEERLTSKPNNLFSTRLVTNFKKALGLETNHIIIIAYFKKKRERK